MTERTSDELREKLCKRINRDKVLAIYQSCDLRDAYPTTGVCGAWSSMRTSGWPHMPHG